MNPQLSRSIFREERKAAFATMKSADTAKIQALPAVMLMTFPPPSTEKKQELEDVMAAFNTNDFLL